MGSFPCTYGSLGGMPVPNAVPNRIQKGNPAGRTGCERELFRTRHPARELPHIPKRPYIHARSSGRRIGRWLVEIFLARGHETRKSTGGRHTHPGARVAGLGVCRRLSLCTLPHEPQSARWSLRCCDHPAHLCRRPKGWESRNHLWRSGNREMRALPVSSFWLHAVLVP